MGYSRYWTWRQAPTPEALAACIAEMRGVVDESETEVVAFDAAAPIAIIDADETSEPFCFPSLAGGEGVEVGAMNFCKVHDPDYDALVTGLLRVAQKHFPPATLYIRSDVDHAVDDDEDLP